MPLRKLQHRVDILDRLYTHLRRCNQLCDGRRPVTTTSTHVCRPMSPGSVRRVHAILSAALNYGVSWGWIERNPADYAHPPKLTRRRAAPPSPEQVARLLNAAAATDDELAVFLWLAVTTGARRGELVALRWSDLDLERGVLRLASNYVVRSGQRQLKGTKTGEERLLSLDAATVGVLTDLHAARAAALARVALRLPSDAFVLTPDPSGARPWHPDHFTHAYRALADELGIVEPLKNLRHFNATQLLAAGVDLRTTAGRLGHSDGGATTLRVYASWTRPADQRAVELLAGDLTELRAQSAAAPAAPKVPAQRRGLARARLVLADVLPMSLPLRDYRQLAEALRDAIRTETTRPGRPFPSAAALAAHTAWPDPPLNAPSPCSATRARLSGAWPLAGGDIGAAGPGHGGAGMTNDTASSPLHLRLPSPLEPLDDDRLAARGVRLLLKRDDLISPDVPGNKWRKLKYNLADAAAAESTRCSRSAGRTPTTSARSPPLATASVSRRSA